MARRKSVQMLALDAGRRIRQDFGYLVKQAYRGDREAARLMHDTLHAQLRTFVYLCGKAPGLFRPIAHKNSDWPGFLSTDPKITLDRAELFRKLKLGSENQKTAPADKKTAKL